MNKTLKLLGTTCIALCGFLLSSCELLETPEYPDSDFNIVGTWEYKIPPCEGTEPEIGTIYNAVGRITFTEDMEFSFVIDANNIKAKGYGTYTYDEDSGICLTYKVSNIADVIAGANLSQVTMRDCHISWGNEGDKVEDDYLRVHSIPSEYRRIETLPLESILLPYRIPNSGTSTTWSIVTHGGDSQYLIPVSDDPVKP